MTATARTYIAVDAYDMVVFTDWRSNDFSIEGAGNALSWATGLAPFKVYARNDNDVSFGLIGTTDAMAFLDTGAAPDFSQPWAPARKD
jgi:hypothetical protein